MNSKADSPARSAGEKKIVLVSISLRALTVDSWNLRVMRIIPDFSS